MLLFERILLSPAQADNNLPHQSNTDSLKGGGRRLAIAIRATALAASRYYWQLPLSTSSNEAGRISRKRSFGVRKMFYGLAEFGNYWAWPAMVWNYFFTTHHVLPVEAFYENVYKNVSYSC